MASQKPCAACLRLLRRNNVAPRTLQSPSISSSRAASSLRAFSTTLSNRNAGSSSSTSTSSSNSSSADSSPVKPLPKSAYSSAGTTTRLAQEVRRRAGGTTETYVAYGATKALFTECARHADYNIPQLKGKTYRTEDVPKTAAGEDLGVGTGWWYESLGLQPTFNTWAQITFLNMYLFTVRFRCFHPSHAQAWHQHLLDHFFYAAEDRMADQHGLYSRGIRNKYLKDLFVQWRGAVAGYDEGLVKGDAVVATAIWRNIFKADPEVDWTRVAQVVSYLRRVLKGLDGLPDDMVVSGKVRFTNPGKEDVVVAKESAGIKAPFTREDDEAAKVTIEEMAKQKEEEKRKR
ncbi:hypothetical protein L228DRAFT_231075 [Xylona heveae TC161]|uniref:Ubiquinol-cytochrome c chaperone domain-containing protein n=1 Tax=Xylona heveae (strain CBS 132557 / TC161) TaxID=1328760 RepID=A0A165FZG7_XYLHT|nr:hypothetical protein L228DRAFT_231075 [Xylona heveae TC161]KZF21566.1 hypothetical protein L228DRAFT_231075 [Xylona heveae TC161]